MRENMKIRKAELKDLSRIAEIFVFNNRINYFPIFHEEAYSFGEMQVVPMIDQYFKKEEILNRIYVYDDGIIRGFTEINGTEICKLYVDPCLQNNGVGHGLITFRRRCPPAHPPACQSACRWRRRPHFPRG